MLTLFLLLHGALASELASTDHVPDRWEACFGPGLRVVAIPQHDRPAVGIAVAYPAGAAAEPSDARGMAHLVEHLTYQARDGAGHSRIERLAELGADYNAFTSTDAVVYLSAAPKRAVRALLDLELARMQRPLEGVDEATFAAEREVVAQELVEGGDAEGPSEALLAEMYGEQAARARSAGGTTAQVRALTHAQATAFAEAAYDPAEASLVLLGNLDLDQARSLILAALPEGWRTETPCAAPAAGWAEPTGTGDLARGVGAVDEPTTFFAWSLPPGPVPAYHAEVLAYALDDAREDTSCWVEERQVLTLLACAREGEVDPARIDEELAALGLRLEGARVDETHHLHGHAWWTALHLRTAHARAIERIDVSPGGALYTLAKRSLAGIDPLYTSPGAPASRPAAPVLDTARTLTGGPHATVVLVPPDHALAEATPHTPRRPTRRSGTPPTDAELRDRLSYPSFEGFKTAVLPSGDRVSFLPHPGEGYTLVASRSAPLDPWRWAGTEEWLADGWEGLDSLQRSAAIDGQTVPVVSARRDSIRIRTHGDATLVATRLSAQLLEGQLPLLDKRDAEDIRADLERERRELLDDDEVRTYAAVWHRLSAGAPHPWMHDDGFARVLAVKRGQAANLLRGVTTPEQTHLVVVGGAHKWTDVLATAQQVLGERPSHRASAYIAPPPPTPPAPDTPTLTVVEARRAKGLVQVACRLDGDDPIARELLERHLHAELNDALRQQQALTYGVHTSRTADWLGNVLWIETEVPQDRVGTAISTIHAALDQVGRGELDPDTLQWLKADVARGTALEYQTQAELAELVVSVVGTRGNTQAPSFEDRLLAATPASLGDAVQHCVGRTQTAVAGDAATVEAALTTAGLAVTEVVAAPR